MEYFAELRSINFNSPTGYDKAQLEILNPYYVLNVSLVLKIGDNKEENCFENIKICNAKYINKKGSLLGKNYIIMSDDIDDIDDLVKEIKQQIKLIYAHSQDSLLKKINLCFEL